MVGFTNELGAAFGIERVKGQSRPSLMIKHGEGEVTVKVATFNSDKDAVDFINFMSDFVEDFPTMDWSRTEYE